jgi:hypothetical protein
MASEIRLRVLGDEEKHLDVIRQYLNWGQTDSEIIRNLLREKAEKLQKDKQPALNRIQYHTRAIQSILDDEAARQQEIEDAAEIDEIRRGV